MIDIQPFLDEYNALKVRRSLLIDQMEQKKEKLIQQELYYEDCLKAQAVIQKVKEETQNELKMHLTNPVTLALKTVLGDEYGFGVDFVQKRGTIETEFYIEKDGHKIYNFLDYGGAGLGASDIVSIVLIPTVWLLGGKKQRPFFVWDEPGKHVSIDLYGKFCEMIMMLCEKLKLQILMITHISEFEGVADKLFKVTHNGEYSVVKEVQ